MVNAIPPDPSSGGGAPLDAEYLTGAADPTLTDEIVVDSSNPLAISRGGTGANSLAGILANLNLTFPLVAASGGTGVGSLQPALNKELHDFIIVGDPTYDIQETDGPLIWLTGGATTANLPDSAPSSTSFLVFADNSGPGTLHSALGIYEGTESVTNDLVIPAGNTVEVIKGNGAYWITINRFTTFSGDLLGTVNQVNVSGGTSKVPGADVTLSLPQDIATSSSPTFTGLTTSQQSWGAIDLAVSGTYAFAAKTMVYFVGCLAGTMPAFASGFRPVYTVINANSAAGTGQGNVTLTTQGSDIFTWGQGSTGSSIVVGPGQRITLWGFENAGVTAWAVVTQPSSVRVRGLNATTYTGNLGTFGVSMVHSSGGTITMPTLLSTALLDSPLAYIRNDSVSNVSIVPAGAESFYTALGAVSSITLAPNEALLMYGNSGATQPGWHVIADTLATLPVNRGGTGLATTVENAILGSLNGTTLSSTYAVPLQDGGELSGVTSVAYTDACRYTCNGTFTITIPTADTDHNGFVYRFKNIGSGLITVAPTSGTIDGLASVTLAALDSRDFQILNGAWYLV